MIYKKVFLLAFIGFLSVGCSYLKIPVPFSKTPSPQLGIIETTTREGNSVISVESYFLQANVDLTKCDPKTRACFKKAGISVDERQKIIVEGFDMNGYIWINLYVFNTSDTAFIVNPNSFVMTDGENFMMRRLEPHEIANLYLANIQGVPLYTPKYNYTLQMYSQGNLALRGTLWGYQGNYTGQTYGTITQTRDASYDWLWLAAASSIQRRNEQNRQAAQMVYDLGIIPDTKIPGHTNFKGALYWQSSENIIYPITLKMPEAIFKFTK